MIAKMKSLYILMALAGAPFLFTSCHTEDPGPLRDAEKSYYLEDFDRLEIGDAFDIRVREGTFFAISARGDERNIDDLIVRKEGSTLVIRYDDHDKRKHQTYLEITMPSLLEANFSGASNSTISGFTEGESFRVTLSGASVSQIDMDVAVVNTNLSGASSLTLTGSGEAITAVVSGASALKAFNFPVDDADLNLSGASSVKVSVATNLKVVATGGSDVLYRGTPSVDSDTSGGSSVHQD